MRKPTVHLNGDSILTLKQQHCDALESLHDAMRVLSYTQPHGRNYYPQGSEAISEAHEEHMARMTKLNEVYEEVCEIYNHICDQ